MGEEKTVQTEQKPASYADLKNYCDQLMMQRNQLVRRLDAVTNVVNKLPWLFKVIELKDNFNPGFVSMCIEEIQEIMTPPEEDKKDTKEEN